MSPRNRNILTVEDWPDPKMGKLYKCLVKKVDTDKKAKCICVAVENLDRTQLGRIHDISLPLPIRPSVCHKTCSFLLACGIDASTHGKEININDTIGSIIGIRFGTKEQDGSQQIEFEKFEDSTTPNPPERESADLANQQQINQNGAILDANKFGS
ncbi:hypothetical protein ACFL5Z_18570 [Planctomycetota bacterium]